MFKFIIISISLIYLLVGCSNYDYKDKDESTLQRIELEERATSIEGWALRCEMGTVAKEDCGVGDASLFNGLACASGDSLACAASAASQGPNGQVWRAPSRVGVDTENSSSRDMVLGFLLQVLTTKNKDGALALQGYIEANGKLCTDADDNRCDMTPAIWGSMYHVWGTLGLVRSTSMEVNSYILPITLLTQVQVSPTGYQLHLMGVQLFLLKETGYHHNDLVKASEVLVERQPNNPFFQYINGNREGAAKLTLEQAPTSQPPQRTQWSFERDTAEEAYLDSMGHEFLMIIRLILQ